MNAVGHAIPRARRKCFVDACAGGAPRTCPNAYAGFFHGLPLRRSFGVEANQTLNVPVA
jgi:hypothetical protein